MDRLPEYLAACGLAAKYVSEDEVHPEFLVWAFARGYMENAQPCPEFFSESSRQMRSLIRQVEIELLAARLPGFLRPRE